MIYQIFFKFTMIGQNLRYDKLDPSLMFSFPQVSSCVCQCGSKIGKYSLKMLEGRGLEWSVNTPDNNMSKCLSDSLCSDFNGSTDQNESPKYL